MSGPDGFATRSVEAVPGRLTGRAGPWHWDLTERPDQAEKPLYTFPRWAWNKELLPAAHLVATPGARYDGTVSHQDGRILRLTDAPGPAPGSTAMAALAAGPWATPTWAMGACWRSSPPSPAAPDSTACAPGLPAPAP